MVQADNYKQREEEECLEVSLTLLELSSWVLSCAMLKNLDKNMKYI